MPPSVPSLWQNSVPTGFPSSARGSSWEILFLAVEKEFFLCAYVLATLLRKPLVIPPSISICCPSVVAVKTISESPSTPFPQEIKLMVESFSNNCKGRPNFFFLLELCLPLCTSPLFLTYWVTPPFHNYSFGRLLDL